ncbi:hypothetical protein ACFQET_00830 [Levilactobacillus tangyuanensis]|uniref:GW domain-containing protein n=1 Tax=Levilactobacillus tangyuanensis TaxID=2486021 RepID=A0ABW1TMW8_9LACO|nr:hypothetical protein [Levilactobacillus tangyuanensis]
MKWIKLLLGSSLGLLLWGTGTTAQAAKKMRLPAYPQQRLFTAKHLRTKVYSYPRGLHSGSRYLGKMMSTKKKWTVVKVVMVHGKKYVRITAAVQFPLQHGTVLRSYPQATAIDGGYVALSKLKSHQQISRMPTIPRTPYFEARLTSDFWWMPYGTVGSNYAAHYGTTYGYRTIYAIQSLTTVKGKQYLLFENAKGEVLGWLPKSVVVKGQYPDLMQRELTRDTPVAAESTKIRVLDSGRHVKIGIAKTAGKIQRVVLLDQDSQTTVYDYQDGKAVKKTIRGADGRLKSSRALTPTSTIKFHLQADYDISGDIYDGTIDAHGKITIPYMGGWVA